MADEQVGPAAVDYLTELLLAGRGLPVTATEAVLVELTAWSAHRTRRIETRSGLKNQLLGQLDRSFPGLTLALPDVLGTKVGRLVATEFADPTRLVALGSSRLIRFGATRGVQIRKPIADKLLAAARVPCRCRMRRSPGRSSLLTLRCSPTWTVRSPKPRSNSLGCCR